MPFCWDYRKHLSLPAFVLKWFMISLPMGITVGSAISFFLWSLDQVTHLRWRYPWSLYLLPLAGAVSALIYHHWGRSAEAGTDLILEQIHQPGGGVPSRMAPLVLICTLMTHLFGGSAGREGTAVQMGGSLAGTWGRWLGLNGADMSILLMTGIAAGFGAVFGTPVTGAVFALEVLAIGRRRYQALIPCLIASLVGDQVNTTWGLDHINNRCKPTRPNLWKVVRPTKFSIEKTSEWPSRSSCRFVQ
jgi:H+/Cl- antiporter ClcA